MKNLSNEELYFKETGDKATYRKDSSDYHTLKYVHWLESKKLENAIEMVCKEIMGEEVKEFETILINTRNLYSTTIDNLKCCGNCKLDRTPDCP